MLTIEQFRQLWQLLSCFLMDDSYDTGVVVEEAAYCVLHKVEKILEEN